MLFDFLRTTQPETWDEFKKRRGPRHRELFLERLQKQIEKRGVLDLLRKGIKDSGCHFKLAYFKPESDLNEEHRRLYTGNIFSVVRQLHYSKKEPLLSLDLALFLNGFPVVTAELKNPLKKQDVQDAIKQYRDTRNQNEPLFKLGRCFAHFAVDPDLVFMTTELKGSSTDFLPFNRGRNGGAGNPDNPNGYRTFYLWKRIWQKDQMLEIIQNFLQFVKEENEGKAGKNEKDGKIGTDGKGRKISRKFIFPRYHQLYSVKKLVTHAKYHGTGHNYLIQHSAGSGKSNTIAWLCLQLCGLHDTENKRVFDSIIVVTDRRVLDRQLQDTITQFEHVKGTVATIKKDKAKNLTAALQEGKDIIICTLQTFPFAVNALSEMPGKHFAVVVDEAHSSQSGEGADSVKKILGSSDLESDEQEEEPEDDEDLVNQRVEAELKHKGRLPNVSFFAFTATPKTKTLELFGTQQPDGSYEPFSLYTMKQAIEEKFILDVLENYTTLKVYFNLLKTIEDDPRYSKKKGMHLLKAYVDNHDHSISKKTAIIIEHFREQVMHRIDGQAKAMLVTKSRASAVRYKLAFDRYIKNQEYPFKTLVAFSGTVQDGETGREFTEAGMNDFPESQTAEVFKREDYRILIVANKFQTGFDQPLLYAMYVDKRLGGVNAVQTLSRLNRKYPDKEDTMVLDFENEADLIQRSFRPYYEKTLLTEATDPNKLYDFEYELKEYHIFEEEDVETFSREYFSPKGKQEKLHSILSPVVDRYLAKPKEEQHDFRTLTKRYVRLYSYLSHVIPFKDVDLEKLYQFLRHLHRKLPVSRDRLPVEIIENINMDSYRIQQTSSGKIVLEDEEGRLRPTREPENLRKPEEELTLLSIIIHEINDRYGADFTDADKIKHFSEDMERRLVENEKLSRAADPEVNTKNNFKLIFNDYFDDVLNDMIDSNLDLYTKINDDKDFGNIFKKALFDSVYRYLTVGKKK